MEAGRAAGLGGWTEAERAVHDRDRGGGHAARPGVTGRSTSGLPAPAAARRPSSPPGSRPRPTGPRSSTRPAALERRSGRRGARRAAGPARRGAREQGRRSPARAPTRARPGRRPSSPRTSRYRYLHDTMRELARREPTFAMHVHVGVADPELAIADGEPDARSPAAAARAVGQLALLAGAGQRPGLGSDADLLGLSAGRHPARVRRLRRLRQTRCRP